MKKSLLFILAGLWLIFILSEQFFNLLLGNKANKKPVIFRLIMFLGKIVKSVIVFSLVVFNVFMAISLIGESKK